MTEGLRCHGSTETDRRALKRPTTLHPQVYGMATQLNTHPRALAEAIRVQQTDGPQLRDVCARVRVFPSRLGLFIHNSINLN